jgi:hypothetical protein
MLLNALSTGRIPAEPDTLESWLRSGNAGAGQGAVQFLSEALSLIGAKHRIRCVRADSCFFGDNFLQFLEERALPYIVVARLTTYLKSRLYRQGALPTDVELPCPACIHAWLREPATG